MAKTFIASKSWLRRLAGTLAEMAERHCNHRATGKKLDNFWTVNPTI